MVTGDRTGVDLTKSDFIPERALIYIHETAPVLHVNKTVEFICEVSSFLLISKIIKFALIFENGDPPKYIDQDQTSPENVEEGQESDGGFIVENVELGYSFKKIRVNLTIGVVGIMCLSPWHNSSDWLSTSRHFQVKVLAPPQIKAAQGSNLLSFRRHEENHIECPVTGEPHPEVSWFGPGPDTVQFDKNRFLIGPNGESVLKFGADESYTLGHYECFAQNDLGNDSFIFQVDQAPDTNVLGPIGVSGIVLAIFAFLLSVLVSTIMRKRYLDAKKELDQLPEDEYQEIVFEPLGLVADRQVGAASVDVVLEVPQNDVTITENEELSSVSNGDHHDMFRLGSLHSNVNQNSNQASSMGGVNLENESREQLEGSKMLEENNSPRGDKRTAKVTGYQRVLVLDDAIDPVLGYTPFSLLNGVHQDQHHSQINHMTMATDHCPTALQFNPNESYMLTLKDFEIAEGDLDIVKESILGEGQFGKVCRGFHVGQAVAVKIPAGQPDNFHFKLFMMELKIWAYVGKHEHVVEFRGAVINRVRQRIAFGVIELSPFGNLHDYLSKFKAEYGLLVPSSNSFKWRKGKNVIQRPTLNFQRFLDWSIQVANGMSYLSSKKVIHGDLATRNILLFHDNVTKITDFGFSRKWYEHSYKMKERKEKIPLPYRWMAIESLESWEFSSASDVWAYGITVWEMFSFAQLPYAGTHCDAHFLRKIKNGLRVDQPAIASDEIYQVILSCCHDEPNRRPSFDQLAATFVQLLESHLTAMTKRMEDLEMEEIVETTL